MFLIYEKTTHLLTNETVEEKNKLKRKEKHRKPKNQSAHRGAVRHSTERRSDKMETEDNQVNTFSHPPPPPPAQHVRAGVTQETNKDLLRMEKIDDNARRQKMYQSFLIQEHKTERVKPSPCKEKHTIFFKKCCNLNLIFHSLSF